MTREAVDIILKLWTTEPPFEYHGEYWQVIASVGWRGSST
jgi:alkanesulfonate monooxygenase SsuD/methylene tetrahydromethanopterin reductase-like flavin-dependent oxidoreductase (luciferase family)